MRQGKLLSEPVNAIKNKRQNPLIKKLLFTGAVLLCLPILSLAQPVFVGSTPQYMNVCENAGATSISSFLPVIDPSIGNTDTWSIDLLPAHGTLAGFPVSHPSSGSVLSVGAGVSYTPATGFSGTDSFRIKIDDGVGDMDFTTIIVTVTPPPTVSPITGPASVCVGATITLSDATLGGSWGATNTIATVAGGTVTGGAVPGNDTISYAVTGTCGTTTVTTNVTVTLLPDPGVIFGPNTVCPAAIITVFNTVAGGVWDVTNANASIDLVGDVTGVSTGVDTIKYSVTQACGTATALYPVTVQAMPVSGTITGPSVVCVGSSVTFSDPVPGGFWNRQNAFASVSGGGIVTGVSQGVDTIIYTVINACSLSNSYLTITVNPLPFSGTISGTATSVCVGSTITLTDGAPGGAWSVINPHASIVPTGVVTGISGGLDTVKYAVTNSCGTAVSIYTFTVNPLSNAGAIVGPVTVCVNDSIFLTDPTASGGGTGVWSMTNTKATINTTGKVIGNVAGLDTVVYTYTNMCNTAVTKLPVTVNPLPNAGVITGPTTVCAHYQITLVDTTSGGTWSISAANATIGTAGLVTGVTAGAVNVSYTYTNMCGTVVATYPDTVLALPDSGAITGLNSVCTGATITLSDPAAGGTWSSSTGGATVSAGVVTGVSAGVLTISYSVTNVCRTAVAVHTVTVNTVPSAGVISGDTSICADVLVTLTESVPGGVWSVNNDSVLLDVSGVISGVYPGGHATVTYTVTNECGTTHTTFPITILPNYVCWHTYVNPLSQVNLDFEIFPNPAFGDITLKADAGLFQNVIITNQLGQQVLRQALVSASTELSLNGLPTGMYYVTLTGENGSVTRKLIKE